MLPRLDSQPANQTGYCDDMDDGPNKNLELHGGADEQDVAPHTHGAGEKRAGLQRLE